MRVLPVRHALSHGPSTSFSSEGLSLSCWIYMQQFFAGRVNSAYASCVTEGEALPPAYLLFACLPACLPVCSPLHPFIFSAGVAASSFTDQQQWGRSMVSLGRPLPPPCRDARGPSTWGVTAPPA
jgi:hypothetical protein